MSIHKIVLDGQKYETQEMIDSLLQSVLVAVRGIYGKIGVFGTRFRELDSKLVDNYLGAMEDNLKQLREIQKQLQEEK